MFFPLASGDGVPEFLRCGVEIVGTVMAAAELMMHSDRCHSQRLTKKTPSA